MSPTAKPKQKPKRDFCVYSGDDYKIRASLKRGMRRIKGRNYCVVCVSDCVYAPFYIESQHKSEEEAQAAAERAYSDFWAENGNQAWGPHWIVCRFVDE